MFLRALSAFPLPTLPPPYLAGERMHVHVHVHVCVCVCVCCKCQCMRMYKCSG